VFNARGRVALIASSARGDSAGTTAVGGAARSIPPRARRVAGAWIAPSGRRGSVYIYGMRRGRIAFAAVAQAAEVRSAKRLQKDLRAAGLT
jgi:hypothetical protein